jgi:hypothetical protein
MGDFNDFEDVDGEDEDVIDDEDNYDEGVMLVHRKMGQHFQHIHSQTCKCCPPHCQGKRSEVTGRNLEIHP